jgi:hypothetical protein
LNFDPGERFPAASIDHGSVDLGGLAAASRHHYQAYRRETKATRHAQMIADTVTGPRKNTQIAKSASRQIGFVSQNGRVPLPLFRKPVHNLHNVEQGCPTGR